MNEGTSEAPKLDDDIVTRIITGCYDCQFTVPIDMIMKSIREHASKGAYTKEFKADESAEIVVGAVGGALAGHAAYSPGHKVWIKIRKGKG